MKPTLYANRLIPMGQLDPTAFRDFCAATLRVVGPRHGINILPGDTSGADEGIDIYGEDIGTGEAIVFQCKRYSEALTPSTVSLELAKLALRSASEDQQISKHYIITSGSLGKMLHGIVTGKNHDWTAQTSEYAKKHKDLETLRTRATALSVDTEKAVRRYIGYIGSPIIWSGTDFNIEIGYVYSELSDTIERFFEVHSVLREHPRPDFDWERYRRIIETMSHGDHWMKRNIGTTRPLPNIHASEHPIRIQRSQFPPPSHFQGDLLSTVCKEIHPNLTILSGASGAGKTTCLKILSADLLKMREEPPRLPPLPIFINMAGYRDDLDRQIRETLSVNIGTWSSLPFEFWILFDGIDRMGSDGLEVFQSEIRRLIQHQLFEKEYRIILSCRTTGPLFAFDLPTDISAYLSLLPPTWSEVWKFVVTRLGGTRSREFFSQYWMKTDFAILEVPFGLTAAIDMFEDPSAGGGTRAGDLVEHSLQRIIERSQSTRANLDDSLRSLPVSLVIDIAAHFAFGLRTQRGSRSAKTNKLQNVISDVADIVRAKYGMNISYIDITQILKHYGIIQVTSGVVSFSHDIYFEWLVSIPMSERWSDFQKSVTITTDRNLWIFCGMNVPENEVVQFIDEVSKVSMSVAMEVSIARAPSYSSKLVNAAIEHLETGSLRNDDAYDCVASLVCSRSDVARDFFLQIRSEPPSPLDSLNIENALCLMGCRSIQVDILSRADASPPGFYDQIWGRVEPVTAISIARERFDQESENSGYFMMTTIETLGFYGDDDDASRIIKAIEKVEGHPDLKLRYIHSLSDISGKIADDYCRKQLSMPGCGSVLAASCTCFLGNSLSESNLRVAVPEIFSNFSAVENSGGLYPRLKLTLCLNPLPSSCVDVLLESVSELPDSDFWQMVSGTFSNKLTCYALTQALDMKHPSVHAAKYLAVFGSDGQNNAVLEHLSAMIRDGGLGYFHSFTLAEHVTNVDSRRGAILVDWVEKAKRFPQEERGLGMSGRFFSCAHRAGVTLGSDVIVKAIVMAFYVDSFGSRVFDLGGIAEPEVIESVSVYLSMVPINAIMEMLVSSADENGMIDGDFRLFIFALRSDLDVGVLIDKCLQESLFHPEHIRRTLTMRMLRGRWSPTLLNTVCRAFVLAEGTIDDIDYYGRSVFDLIESLCPVEHVQNAILNVIEANEGQNGSRWLEERYFSDRS
jgi:hypothetical protein